MEDQTWYVVYTRPRWEKKVAEILARKGIENYCPLNKVERQWSDRKKIIKNPLFKGYVFVKVPEILKWDVKKVDGIINYVYWLGSPAKVKDVEIDTIKKFLQEFDNVEVIEKASISDSVMIRQGVLMNYKGVVLETSGNKVRVLINSMGLYLTAVFDYNNLSIL